MKPCLDNILKHYEAVSGQHIYFTKSSIQFSHKVIDVVCVGEEAGDSTSTWHHHDGRYRKLFEYLREFKWLKN